MASESISIAVWVALAVLLAVLLGSWVMSLQNGVGNQVQSEASNLVNRMFEWSHNWCPPYPWNSSGVGGCR
ncbi:MAG: hypothetical protein HYY22_07885 [Thaumarchaeota archaeon]|nr:hypothetical protein [Nitrososphaerota archaeon]